VLVGRSQEPQRCPKRLARAPRAEHDDERGGVEKELGLGNEAVVYEIRSRRFSLGLPKTLRQRCPLFAAWRARLVVRLRR
jgi:hypothetical protein